MGNNQTIMVEMVKEIILSTISNLKHSLDYYLMPWANETVLKPAIGYIRFSSLKQKDKYSVDIQKQEIERRAKAEGYFILLWCIDESVSATHNSAIKRPWMRVLYQVALMEDFMEAIFFYDDSRTSRQTTDFVMQVYKPLITLKPYLKFFCTDYSGEWDPDDPLIQIRSLINREKSIDLRNRTLGFHSTILNSENNFRRPASHLPFGYMKGTERNPRIDVSDGQAYIVFLIYYLSSWGYSNAVIAKYLNKCNVPSPKGKEWTQGTIDKILHNQFYLGHTTWNVRESRKNSKRKPLGQFDLFNDTHDSIIPPYLGTLVSQMRNFKLTFGQKMDTPFKLKGLIKCTNCECTLEPKNTTSGTGGSTKRVYRCNSCKNYIDIDAIHDVVFKKLFSYLGINKVQMLEGSKKVLTKWLKVLKEQSNEIEQKKDYVKYLEGTFNYELIGHEDELKRETKHMLFDLQAINDNVIRLQEQIESLLNDSELDTSFNQFFGCKQESISLTELRCLTLIFISDIKYNFKTKVAPAIHFNKTPFLDVEEWVKLTAN